MFVVNVEAAVYKDDQWLIIERSLKEDHAGGSLAFVGGRWIREQGIQPISWRRA
ncbi:hypothetical protein QUF84_03595 [Fictibacillus enclensis]|uniref:hypothetical protein n=1 Tax=Fictibacillus enclensis TaxID=1017270 RepID=UPI0025A17867|nr:hypothetical protein [Fictibacillus enclensis]MDM5336317.1 hypothetical protein [Fictibacillus enclensis]